MHVELPRGSTSAVRSTILCAVLLVLSGAPFSHSLQAQSDRDTWGQEFWVAFMENQGSDPNADYSTVRLYMASEVATTVRIEYHPYEGALEIPLDQPGVPVELDINGIFGNDTELPGVFQDGSNAVTDRSFRITSDDDITLYGASLQRMSADAFIALPDDVLSRSYIIAGWENGLLDVPSSGFPREYDRHSEFAVIATEDGTVLRIEPTTPLVGFSTLVKGETIEVGLDRGDVFFGQAVLGAANDVSGTRIRATKPIAVFSGNQRTAIPTDVGNYRDHLVEQMPPIEAWGTEALLAPHATVDPRVPYEALARVQAAFEGTELQITTCRTVIVDDGNGGFQESIVETTRRATIGPEDRFLISPLEPTRIVADRPILVTQYEHSVGGIPNNPDPRVGDPFMMVVPSPEQFGTTYPFQSIDQQDMLAHYINVIIEEGAESSLVLDGASIGGSQRWEKMPGGGYLFAQIRVPPGAHRIEADAPFGLAAYGFGHAISYGYVGGSFFRDLPVDFLRPTIDLDDECALLRGVASDADVTDSGIDSLYAMQGSINVLLDVADFSSGDESVDWTAELVDPYQDGLLLLKAIDKAGRSSERRIEIPGFTVGVVSLDGLETGDRVDVATYNGRDSCYSVTLHNYGAYRQELERIDLISIDGGADGAVETPMPVVLEPGDSTEIRVCVSGGNGEEAAFRLDLGSSCLVRPGPNVVRFDIIDTTGPQIATDAGDCSDGFVLRFTEENRRFFGVESVTVDAIDNAEWVLVPGELPSATADLIVTPIDERQDVVITATAFDRAGNRTVASHIFPGFTLAVNDRRDARQLAIRLASEWMIDTVPLYEERCDSVDLTNYGLTTLDIARVYMTGNLRVSIPPSQLPLTIPSGESRRIRLCFEGNLAGDVDDTLVFEDKCGRSELVRARATVPTVLGSGTNACGNIIDVAIRGAARRLFIETPIPNPMRDGRATVVIGIPEETIAGIDLVRLDGRVEATILAPESVPAGLHRVAFDPGKIPSGTYFVRLVTSDGTTETTRLIVAD